MTKKCPKCPQCLKNENIVSYGKYKYKDKYRQRYKCTQCRITFQDKNYSIKYKKEKELAIALYNLLNIKPDGIESNLNLSKLLQSKIDTEEFSIKIGNSGGQKRPIIHNTPKILLCLDEKNNSIEIIPLPDYCARTYKVRFEEYFNIA